MENATLEVTAVQLYHARGNGKLKGIARVLLNDQLQLTNLRIEVGSSDLFVAYPNDPTYKGEDYRQMYYPVTAELRAKIEKAVLDKYHKEYHKLFENQNKEKK